VPNRPYDQENDGPRPRLINTDENGFFTAEAELGETKTRLTIADAVAVIGVLAIAVGPFTIALAAILYRATA
jgi:hypothetical protein